MMEKKRLVHLFWKTVTLSRILQLAESRAGPRVLRASRDTRSGIAVAQKKNRSQVKGVPRSTTFHSGAEHDAKMRRCKWKDLKVDLKVEGSEGGMTNGAFSQNAHSRPGAVAVQIVWGEGYARNGAGALHIQGQRLASQRAAGGIDPTSKTQIVGAREQSGVDAADPGASSLASGLFERCNPGEVVVPSKR